ncbi:ABC transporter ATP-binding protein [uncultured Algimonas sp.]|uniref:ABC transporter ATP-binding protein n=1 Tax=uncultured Algimonas sp. TaxID=1547920 RepID=UPI002620B7D9|nr:ABC transporter ATP-binding protein [uncultured Algimonas sp.]
MSAEPVLSLQDVTFGYAPGDTLIDIDRFCVAPGESVFLRGASGTGKSTLLGLIGGILVPRSGRISLCGTDLTTLSGAKRDAARVDHLGIIFQQFNLLPYLSVLGNAALPCRFSARRRRRLDMSPDTAARKLVTALGLTDRELDRPVSELSVGQQQRVAVARALIGGPDLIVADEPTSALDHDNRDRFITLLDAQRKRFGSSLLFVSHDATLAGHFDRAVDMAELTGPEKAQAA